MEIGVEAFHVSIEVGACVGVVAGDALREIDDCQFGSSAVHHQVELVVIAMD